MKTKDLDFRAYFEGLLKNVQIMDFHTPADFKAHVLGDGEVRVWLSKLSFKTHRGYVDAFCYFLRCVGLTDPGRLLDLKKFEDSRERFFPAEQLVETWILLAREKGVPDHRVKKVADAVRSFFKRSRVQLIGVSCSYVPGEKPTIDRDGMLLFRDQMTGHARCVFDFLVSVPLRDGQFQVCPRCRTDFHPKWRNILSYPTVEAGSPFVIRPEKGHENPQKYPPWLRQVCFLTETAAKQLNLRRAWVERVLGRRVRPDEYIFTYSQHSRYGEYCVSPLNQDAVKMLFYNTQPKAGIRIYPHLIRSWVNSVLASCGIDQQFRGVYLGHNVSAREEGYYVQMIPLWRQVFREKHALEALDVVGPGQYQLVDLERRYEELKHQLESPRQKMLEEVERLLSDPEIMEKLRKLKTL